jgi:5-methylcytosine-specific restriction endonuclease McrA
MMIKYRKSKKFRDERKKKFREWFSVPSNKEKHKTYMIEYYRKHRDMWNMRSYTTDILRDEIMEIYDYKCAVCGSQVNLETHHINYNVKERTKTASTIESIVLLCRDCHRKLHRYRKIKGKHRKVFK